MKRHARQNRRFVLFVAVVAAFCPLHIFADSQAEERSFEHGYELGREFQRGYEAGRRADKKDSLVIASGNGVSLGLTRYNFRDWDESWGLSVSLTPWQQKATGDADLQKSRMSFGSLRFGWFPLRGSFMDTVSVSSFPQTITKEVGFSIEGNAYFFENLGGKRYPLTETASIPVRAGFGLTWFDLEKTDNITIDGLDYTEAFDQKVDFMMDFHFLIGAGLEIHTSRPAFAAGAMVGYRFTIWELWGIETTFTDPDTGRQRSLLDSGSEFFNGSARGVTADLYFRYLF